MVLLFLYDMIVCLVYVLCLARGEQQSVKGMARGMQVEGRLATQASGMAKQHQHLEVQSMSTSHEDALHSSLPEMAQAQDINDMSSTLQYIAQQAAVTHNFQKEVKSQRQDKSEL